MPPELVITATRGPAGGGWLSRARAASIISSPERTWTIPAWVKAAVHAASRPAREAVCDRAARAPAAERAVRATITGLRGVTRRASS